MKMLICFSIVSFLLLSCSVQEQKIEPNVNTSDVANIPQMAGKDTTINYAIDGISAEGTAVKAKYISSKIKECAISIYGERGQIQIRYIFAENQIKVTEKHIGYKEGVQSAGNTNDMVITKEINYNMDCNGIPIGKMEKERLDIFKELKKAVPFELK